MGVTAACSEDCPLIIYCPNLGSNHCIHNALRCLDNKRKLSPIAWEDDIKTLVEGIKEYLRDHPEEGLEI